MNANELQCARIWAAATEAELGIVVSTNDAARARAMLYRVRQMLADAELVPFQIRVSPDNADGELWLFRRDKVPNTFDLKGVLTHG